MGFAIIEHDKKRYLALRAMSTWDDTDTAHVCLLELTREAVDRWKRLGEIFRELKDKHDVACVSFCDESPLWMPGDEEDPLDDGDGDEIYQPQWSADHARTECDLIEVHAGSLEFTAMGRNTDEHLNAYLWWSDLPKIEAALDA